MVAHIFDPQWGRGLSEHDYRSHNPEDQEPLTRWTTLYKIRAGHSRAAGRLLHLLTSNLSL